MNFNRLQKKLSKKKKKNSKKNFIQYKQHKQWSFGTVNIRTGKESDDGAKIYTIAKELSKTNMEFLLLQEVRYRGIGSKLIEIDTGEKFEYHWSGYKRKREAGVGILIRVDKDIEINDPDFNEPRVMGINLKVHGFNLRIVNAYSPTDCDGTVEQKRKFYSDLNKACQTNNKHQKLLVAGDFNATTEVARYKSNFDGRKPIADKNFNDNGQRLKQFCRSHHLNISSTFFKHKLLHRYTWYSNDRKTKKILDYVLCEQYLQQYMTNCRVYLGFDAETDHRLLKATVYAPTTKRGRKRFCKNLTPPKKRLNIKDLQNKETRELFTNSLNQKLQNIHRDGVDATTRSNILIDVISKTATETIPIKQKSEKNEEIFKNDEPLNTLLNSRSSLTKGTEAYKKATKLIKKRVQFIRNQKLRREAELINQHATRRETEELFRNMKGDHSSFKSTKRNKKCDTEKLKQHFFDHFSTANITNDIPDELIETPEYIKNLQNSTTDINHGPPSIEEIKGVLKTLKNGKASTDVPAELFKYASESAELLTEVHILLSKIWETRIISTSWTHSKLVALWKGAAKGSASDPKAYRGLQVGTTLCKILVIIILNRIKSWYDQTILDQQQGFRSGRGTADGIYITKRVQQITTSMKKPVYVLFVDLSSAFDHINRDWLFKSIRQRFADHEETALFQILQAIYVHTTTALAENPTDIFDIFTGVRQGGPESPPLYNLYMDYVMRVFDHICSEKNINFLKLKFRIRTTATTREERMRGYHGEHNADWSGYADDLELFFETLEDLQSGLEILQSVFKRFGLTVNIKKTKTMIFNFNYAKEYNGQKYPNSIAKLQNQSVENVETFRYLGDEIKYDEPTTGDAEVNLRISIAEAKFYELIKTFTNFRINLKTRVLIVNSIVRSRLTYSCQTWTLTQAQMNKINSTYIQMLRKLVRNGSKTEDFRYIYSNDQILRFCNTSDIPTYVAKQQESYLGHLARQPNHCLTKKLLFNDDQRTKAGRPLETLEDKVMKNTQCTKDQFYRNALQRKRKGHDQMATSDRRQSSRR